MTDPERSRCEAHEEEERRVAQWLRQHPDFFERHPALLSQLEIRHDSGTVSLIERQVSQLRRRSDELEERLGEMMTVASDNERLQRRLHEVGINLLACASPAQLGIRLFNELREPFQCQELALLRFRPEAALPWRAVTQSDFEQRLPGLLRNHRALAGKWRRDELRFLFGESGLQMSSAAVIPLLAGDQPLGVMALGSTEPSHFRSSMDTQFISQLGDLVAGLLARIEREPATAIPC